MKRISKEEKEAMETRPLTKKNIVRVYLLKMKVDDIILIEPKDWTWKSAKPSYLCRRVEEQTGWRFECEQVVAPTPGWVVTRVE